MSYTRLSELIWSWEPFVSLSSDARILWLALYTGATAKRLLPGLWQGAPQQMADEARLPSIETINALDTLLDREIVEYDPRVRVLRLTKLPDAGDWPTSFTIMRSWWRRFITLPPCAVRDAHVVTLRWLLERGAALSEENQSGKPSPKHEEVWANTFGTVTIPPVRRRGLRHASADTSTATQPSLFTNLLPEQLVSATPCDSNKIGWHPGGPVEVEVEVEVEPLQGRVGSGGGEAVASGSSTARANAGQEVQISGPRSPTLELVPLPEGLPFSIADMLTAVASQSAGRFSDGPIDERSTDALVATIRACQKASVGFDDLRCVGRWLAAGGLQFRSDLGPVWLSRAGNLLDAVGQARSWRERGEPRVGPQSRAMPAVDPAPATAFGNGRKVLR